MKVFVYDKKESKPIACFTNVVSIEEKKSVIRFCLADKSTMEFDKKIYKSTTYQN